MTREEFIERAKEYNYKEIDITEMLSEVDSLMADAPEGFEFDYESLILFEQPEGDI